MSKAGEINIHSLSSLMAATSLTKEQIDEYTTGLGNKIFEVKRAQDFKEESHQRSESVQIQTKFDKNDVPRTFTVAMDKHPDMSVD